MKKRIYLDNASTTAVLSEVLDAFSAYANCFANPSSIHADGRAAREAIESARKQIADAIQAEPYEIYFTSGGTESDNWAIKGIALQGAGKKIITSCIEHPAILKSCEWLEQLGYEIVRIPVDREGAILLDSIEKAIDADTALISVMTANNEIGTIQPIRQIGELARRYKIPFHTDAVQACGAIPIDVNRMHVDLLSISGHKFHALKGIGALYIRSGTKIEPIIHGGGQEKGMRSGTENVLGAVSLGIAIEKAVETMDQRTDKLIKLRNILLTGIAGLGVKHKINGSMTNRLPNNLNVSFPEAAERNLVMRLDYNGISCSSGSACSAGKNKPSHVLKAIGCTEAEMQNSLRFTLSEENTEAEIEQVISVLSQVV